MSKTRRDLIDLVLDKLGVLVPGQSPHDEEVDKVDRVIDPQLATDAALGMPYVPDVGIPNPPTGGEIDDDRFLPIADRVAWAAAGGFNQSDSPSLKALSDQAEVTLRLIGRPASTRKVLRTDTQLSGGRGRMPVGNFSRGT
jgi:hypothetical protein